MPEYNCETCPTALTREEYVPVGPTSAVAKHAGLDDPDREHVVMCEACVVEAACEIVADTDME